MLKSIKPDSVPAWIMFLVINIIFFIVITLLISIPFWNTRDNILGLEFPMGQTLLILWICYLLCAITQVETGHIGMLLFRGQPWIELSSGMVLALPGIFKLKTDHVALKTTSFVIPNIETTSPEQVDYEDLGVNPNQYKGDDFHTRMSIGAELDIIYALKKGEYACYLTNLGSEEKIKENMPNIARRALVGEFRKRTVAIILNQMDQIDSKMKESIQNLIDHKEDSEKSWGLYIERVQMPDVIFPDDIVTFITEKILIKMRNFMAIKQAETTGEIKKIGARAQEYEDIHIGRGLAIAKQLMIKAEGVGKAEGYKAIADALNIEEGELIFKLDIMKDTVTKGLESFKGSNTNLFLGSQQMIDMFSFLLPLKDALSGFGSGSKT